MESRQSGTLLWIGFAALLAIGAMLLLAASWAPGTVGWGMMGWGMGWGALFMIVPAALVILLLLVALGGLSPRTGPPAFVPPYPPGSHAIEVLNARYARGEVSREEYLRIRADLEGLGAQGGGERGP